MINPQDLNRHAYVANNPLAYIDPDGEEKIKVIVRTFIPQKTVSMPHPNGDIRTFEGDNRYYYSGSDRKPLKATGWGGGGMIWGGFTGSVQGADETYEGLFVGTEEQFKSLGVNSKDGGLAGDRSPRSANDL